MARLLLSSWEAKGARGISGHDASASRSVYQTGARVTCSTAHRSVDISSKTSMTAKPSSLPKCRILLAEDDDSMRGFLERALAKAGYEVTSFANGEEAHERLLQEPFTLLLTDIVMPRMDGIELARRASEIDPELKIMFITGFAAVILNNEQSAPKEARVLSKPFHLKDLVREVERLLAA
jgi:two-component system, cell cycle response regulator CpdR